MSETRKSHRAGGAVMLVAASVLWSLSGVVVKVTHLPPLAFTFYRSLSGAMVLPLFIPFFRGRRPPVGWMSISVLIYTGVVLFLIIAMTLSTAAAGILLEYTAPVWCALIGWLLLDRRIDGRTGLALVIALAGIAIMIAGRRGGGWIGPVFGLASGISFGALILVLDKLNAGGGVNPASIVFWNNLGVCFILFPATFARHELAGPTWAIVAVLVTGVVQLAVPYVLFQVALQRVDALDASLLTLLEPVLNPVWVALIAKEIPDLATFIGGAAILIAMILEATKPTAAQATLLVE